MSESAPRPLSHAVALTLLLVHSGCVEDPAPPVDDDDVTEAPDDDDSSKADDDDLLDVGDQTGESWTREEQRAPGTVTFTELLYNPPGGQDLEWLELHNPMVLDLDLSGWHLEGVEHVFAEGTVLGAGDYLVVAADPGLLAVETGFADALGPYEGRLSNGGERLRLRNAAGRLIDTVRFDDDAPWPVTADGSGLSLAKIDPDAASDRAEHWTVSATLGGTPGQPNGLDPLEPPVVLELIPLASTWAFDGSGAYPDPDWASPDHDDAAWARGDAVFWAGDGPETVVATARVTADNFFGLYLGGPDATGLRLVGVDSPTAWTGVEEFSVEIGHDDHLYIAAWEAPGVPGGPQMVIAEVDLPDGVTGTDAASFEWFLGPTGATPGTAPPAAPPAVEDLDLLIADANGGGTWAPPDAEAPRTSSPWGAAVGSSFADGTNFIWADTFAAQSVTNTEETYALFRSVAPLLSEGGTTELASIETTTTFRTTFVLDADPAAAKLSLECLVDDGMVVHLNGVEVLRHNMPSGPIDADTLASSPVDQATELFADLPTDALTGDVEVLAVELHQAELDDPDLTFGCALTAEVHPLPLDRPATVLLNEVAPASASTPWVELLGAGNATQPVGGLVLVSSEGDELVLPDGELAPGGFLLLDDLGFAPEERDVLFLYSADRTELLDAVRVGSGLRGREESGGPWLAPSEATPGAANVIELTDDVVIHEIQYHRAPRSVDGEPVTDRLDEWIELYNRGDAAVDLSGWQLVDAVAYTFPEDATLAPDSYLVVAGDAAALLSEEPELEVIGDFEGRLNNRSDRILLLDARGNPADEVRYVDGGRWPGAADGGGSTLELRDPWADNAVAEAWSASDEVDHAGWVSYSYRDTAQPSGVGPDGQWEELVLGLLEAGELLIDDVSVVEDPDGVRTELVTDGGFDAGGGAFRLLGTHGRSSVVPDPDDGANPVLRLVATGATGHMHNHVETTLLQSLVHGVDYEISFRARWVTGSNQLNTRLYFNRLARTTLVAQPARAGTPGAPNSTGVDNAGPTFVTLQHEPPVPEPGEPMTVTASITDPDGVASATLWASIEGGAWQSVAMAESAPGRWEATLEGQAAGATVHFYVEAEDGVGASASSPAAGPDSRALIPIADDRGSTTGLADFRLVMTAADSDWMHEDVNLMSNDQLGATVVWRGTEVFYDVGVRPKGSQRGRPRQPRLGYAVRFASDHPFRGSHTTVMLDRSEGVGFGQREVLLNLVMTAAGSVFGEYNDVVHVVTPRPEHTGPAELQLDRFSNLVLDAQFEDGSAGDRFEYELVYYPTTTDDGTPEGFKLPQPDSVVGTSLTDLGPDKEQWRWVFLRKNNGREDDYTRLMDLGRLFDLPEPDLLDEAESVLDLEQWLRAFAFANLAGVVDQYGGAGSKHNAQFYVRPSDQRILFFPHDLDFFGGAERPVVGNNDLARLLQEPTWSRSYYGHLHDIIDRAYNGEYLARWCDQLGDLLPGQDFDAHCAFVDQRAEWVTTGSPDSLDALYPPIEFAITTQGGANFEVAAPVVTLQGVAWVDVRGIQIDGQPLKLTWLDDVTWQVVVPLEPGDNDLALVALDRWGAAVGGDVIVVTSNP
ncbi:MAG: lamin tail domain-containing protein [Deltaproteobacteria bacterium]|nr:lamin tail domain-containing protein [Deltaproteobacteria bacterium]